MIASVPALTSNGTCSATPNGSVSISGSPQPARESCATGLTGARNCGLARASAIDVGLLLPIWPETFSLTLSELLGAGIPVIAARQGALADRLSGQPYGILVDDANGRGAALRRAGRPNRRICPNPASGARISAHPGR